MTFVWTLIGTILAFASSLKATMLETEFVLKPLASFRTNIGEFFKQFAKSLNDCRYHREHMRFVCRLQRLYLFGILIFDWKGVVKKYTQENKHELM